MRILLFLKRLLFLYLSILVASLATTNQSDATTLRSRVKLLAKEKTKDFTSIIGHLNYKDKNSRNALHHAAMFGNFQLIKFMIANGDGLITLTKDNWGWLPLDYAIREAIRSNKSESMLIVSYILEKTHGINGVDDYKGNDELVGNTHGWPPLNWAILADSPERVEQLITEGSKVLYWITHSPANTLEVAKVMGNKEVMHKLLSTTDIRGRTVLHKIVSFTLKPVLDTDFDRNKRIINALLEQGADPYALDENNQTPLDILESLPIQYPKYNEKRRSQIRKLLQSYMIPNTGVSNNHQKAD